MPRKEKKYHFIYKTTNLINGKYYIGMHSTDNLDDGYMGSGKRIRYSIRKHGRSNHKVEIIEFLNSRKELIKREEEIVNLTEIEKVKCLNLIVGGGCAEFKKKHTDEIKRQISETLSGKTYEELHGENASKEKEKRKNSVKKYWDNISDKERKKRVDKQSGKKGPQKNPEKTVICPHCKKEGRGGLMKRWHFDNCLKNGDKKDRVNGKKVLRVNLDGKIIAEFNSIAAALIDHNKTGNVSQGLFYKSIDKDKLIDGFYYKKK